MIRRIIRRLLVVGMIGTLAAGVTIAICHLLVEKSAADKIYDSVEQVPKRKAAVVMGCARIIWGDRQNLYFVHRINAARELYEAGKCEYIIVTGDNSRENYDEPTDMRDALIAAGIPESKIYRDYAGFRTLDSVVRAKEIFGQSDYIVVSQEFHNERAIFIGSRRGCENLVGFNATAVKGRGGIRTKLREYLARVKTVLDVSLLGTEPKFLGRTVELGGPVT